MKPVELSKIKDSPWRDKQRNPIDKAKVEQLAESINTTQEFWVGVYGRELPDGTVQIAFGHHRVDAARVAGLKEIPIEIRDLTDGEMLSRMARENVDGDLPVILEAVVAAVKAYADGKIQLDTVNPSTRKSVIRYAPSYVPGKEPEGDRRYTADSLAQFLGAGYVSKSGRATNMVLAALSILEMEERGIPEFSIGLLLSSERVVPLEDVDCYNKEDLPVVSYRSAREILRICRDVKWRHEDFVACRDKNAAEIAKLRAKQLELQKKIKDEEEREDLEHKAVVQKLADARREENYRKADELAAKIKAADERAKAKEKLRKQRLKELEEQIEAKKAWEAAQGMQDAYSPIRRDVEAMISKLETVVSERNPFREAVKSLSTRKGITAVDRQRLRMAAVAVADWYHDWVASQFAPLPGDESELKMLREREEAQRNAGRA